MAALALVKAARSFPRRYFGLVAEWQTRRIQDPLLERVWGFKSLLGHQFAEMAEWQTRSVEGAVLERAWEFKSPSPHQAQLAQR